MGDGVNIAARLEGDREAGRDLPVRGRLPASARQDQGGSSSNSATRLKNIAQPIRVYESSSRSAPLASRSGRREKSGRRAFRSWFFPSPTSAAIPAGLFCRRRHREPDDRPFADERDAGDRAKHRFQLQGQGDRSQADRTRAQRTLRARRKRPALGQSHPSERPAHRRRERQSSWAERFDKTVADLFDMQDEIVARLANALNAQLIIAEARRAERAPSPGLDGPLFSGNERVQQGAHSGSSLGGAQAVRARSCARS